MELRAAGGLATRSAAVCSPGSITGSNSACSHDGTLDTQAGLSSSGFACCSASPSSSAGPRSPRPRACSTRRRRGPGPCRGSSWPRARVPRDRAGRSTAPTLPVAGARADPRGSVPRGPSCKRGVRSHRSMLADGSGPGQVSGLGTALAQGGRERADQPRDSGADSRRRSLRSPTRTNRDHEQGPRRLHFRGLHCTRHLDAR